MKQKQTPDFVIKCYQRYSDKIWYDKYHFEALMERLSYLDLNEQELILELTDRFQFQDLPTINTNLLAAYNQIPVQRLDDAKKIVFAPLKSPYNREEEKRIKRRRAEGLPSGTPKNPVSKSCDTIFRLMQIDYPYKFHHKEKIKLCESAEEISHSYEDGTLVVLWDDFVGSGNTAFDVIADLQYYLYEEKKDRIKENNFVVISIFAMATGVNVLNMFNINVYAYRVYSRALSDDENYTETERNLRIERMKSIEKKVVKNIRKSYSLGYERSESLLSILDKSPNNTFPFYWYRSQYNVPPIFPRFK